MALLAPVLLLVVVLVGLLSSADPVELNGAEETNAEGDRDWTPFHFRFAESTTQSRTERAIVRAGALGVGS